MCVCVCASFIWIWLFCVFSLYLCCVCLFCCFHLSLLCAAAAESWALLSLTSLRFFAFWIVSFCLTYFLCLLDFFVVVAVVVVIGHLLSIQFVSLSLFPLDPKLTRFTWFIHFYICSMHFFPPIFFRFSSLIENCNGNWVWEPIVWPTLHFFLFLFRKSI